MFKCVGLYCGRTKLNDNNYSDCGPCLRGFRVNNNGICVECEESPQFYDWLYITFMVFLLITIEWYFTDQCVKRRKLTFDVLALHSIVLFENIFSLLMTLLIVEPFGSFEVKSCSPKRLTDWYTLFFNPSPDYKKTIYCTQEAVYPLYSMIFIFYAISLVAVVFRALYIRLLAHLLNAFSKMAFLQDLVSDSNTAKTVYLTLYAIPALSFIHAIFCGLIYYVFPYIIIIGSIISVALHMAFQLDQRPSKLFVSLFQKRNAVIILCHWLIHAYGIISLTELKKPVIDGSLLALVPFPTIFYIITSKFTDPNKLHIE